MRIYPYLAEGRVLTAGMMRIYAYLAEVEHQKQGGVVYVSVLRV